MIFKIPNIAARGAIHAHKLEVERSNKRLFHHLLSRSVSQKQPQLKDLRLFDFEFFSAELDGFHFSAPFSKEGGSLHRRLVETKKLSRKNLFVRHIMATGGALLDIGANIGLTSIPHAVLGDFHPVVAVEPEPRNFACLEWNAKANGAEMICRRAAVADKLGTLYLKIKSNPTHHHLSKDGKGEPVDVVTVDQLVDEIGRVSLVKVDVQGAEADVLRGAGDLLHKREAAWHMEIMGPKNAEPEDTKFIVSAAETHFDGFMDTRSTAPEILSVTHFRDYLGSLRRKFTDFMFVP